MKIKNLFSESRMIKREGGPDTPPPVDSGNFTPSLRNTINITQPEPKPSQIAPLAAEVAETARIANQLMRKGADKLYGKDKHAENILKAKANIAQFLSPPDRLDPRKGGILIWNNIDEGSRRQFIRDLMDTTLNRQVGWKLPKTETILKFIESLPASIADALSQFKLEVRLDDRNWIGIPSEVAVEIKNRAAEAGIDLPKDPLLVSDVIIDTTTGKFDEKLWKELVVLTLRRCIADNSFETQVGTHLSEKNILDQRSLAPDQRVFGFSGNPTQYKATKGIGSNPVDVFDSDAVNPVTESTATSGDVFDPDTVNPMSTPAQESVYVPENTIPPQTKSPVVEQSVAPAEYVDAVPDPADEVIIENPAKYDEPQPGDELGIFELDMNGVNESGRKDFIKIFSDQFVEIFTELQSGNPEDLKRWLEYARSENGQQKMA